MYIALYIFWSVSTTKVASKTLKFHNPTRLLETFTPTRLLDTYSPLLVYYISRKIPAYSLIRAYSFIRELSVTEFLGLKNQAV
jgi:hypothetical protein